MKAERQYKERPSRVLQLKNRGGDLCFADNRLISIVQYKQINKIHNCGENIFSSQKEKYPTLQRKISGEVSDDKNTLQQELKNRGFSLTIGQSLRLMSVLKASEETYSSYDEIAHHIEDFGLGLTLSSPVEYKEAIDPTKMIGATPATNHQTATLIPHKIEVINEFYRADTRSFQEITTAGGFSAFKEFSVDQAKHFISSWLSFPMSSKKTFSFWWKYPLQRPDIPKANIPFVATGISGVQMGGHAYKISLPLHFIFFNESDLGIGYDGATIDDSNILAIKIDKDEVIFLTKVPIEKIQAV